jgi:hypothetical protein
MHYVLGTQYRGSRAELFDDETPGAESYSFAGLQTAISEGNKRMQQN